MRVAFFGLPIAALLLARDGHELCLAVLSPVEHPGRRRLKHLLPSGRVLDALEPTPDFDHEVWQRLSRASPGLLVSWYWTQLLPKQWLELPERGAIGAHPSLLPRHRGPNPFFWSIDSGDHWTGVSVHCLTPEYDRGDVLLKEEVEVGERDAWQLARALDRPSLRLLRQAVTRLGRGEQIASVRQDEAAATWAPEPSGAALKVDWTWTTERVLRRIRALAPVPGLALEIAGLRVFVTRAVMIRDCPAALLPGEAAVLPPPSGLLAVRTGDGAVGVVRAVAGLGSEIEPGSELGAAELALLVERRRRVLDSQRPRRSE